MTSVKSVPAAPVYIFDEHNEAFYFWHKARLDGFTGGPLDLVHVDAHADMAAPRTMTRSLYPRNGPLEQGELEYYRQLALTDMDIGSFILPAVLTGLIRSVYFVFPSWRNQQKAARRTMNVCSFAGEGKIVKTLTASGAANPKARKALPDLKTFQYATLPLEKTPGNRRVILDIDLDFFACRDSIWNQFAYEIEITREQFQDREAFLREHTLPFSGIAFEFHEKGGRAFVRVSPTKREERSYLPSKEQIAAEIRRLIDTLVAKKIKPAAVTVCRSCFSGFTPKEYVDFIEDELKQALFGATGWRLSLAE